MNVKLGDFDVILMRKDPPFDNEYVYTTYILEEAERSGTLVVNRCQGLRDCNEKIFATHFPQCCPPVLVSADMARLKAFHKEHEDAIFKPLDGMGGDAIFRVQPGDPSKTANIWHLVSVEDGTDSLGQPLPGPVLADQDVLGQSLGDFLVLAGVAHLR